MKFFEDELRKIFGESERLSEDTLFSDKTMITDIGDNLRAKVSFISTFVKDNYDALRIQIIHRDQGELDSHTLKFSDMIGIKNGELVYVPFKKAIAHQQKMDLKDMDIVKILSI